MPDAEDDERHERDGAVWAEDVDEDLSHGLPDCGVNGGVEVLNAEKEGDEEEEAEDWICWFRLVIWNLN